MKLRRLQRVGVRSEARAPSMTHAGTTGHRPSASFHHGGRSSPYRVPTLFVEHQVKVKRFIIIGGPKLDYPN